MFWKRTSLSRGDSWRRLVTGALAAVLLVWGYFYLRVHVYDRAIAAAGRQHQVDPRLIRAVIRQESRFQPRAVGRHGEIGLMQVTTNAAREWAAACQQTNFTPRQLFRPAVNVQAGAWYLGRALRYWGDRRADPLPYALAEYNAGRANAARWAAADNGQAARFQEAITYSGTRQYVREILSYYRGSR